MWYFHSHECVVVSSRGWYVILQQSEYRNRYENPLICIKTDSKNICKKRNATFLPKSFYALEVAIIEWGLEVSECIFENFEFLI